MARPQKVGLDYFPLDTDIDQDDKVAIIEAQHGMLGFGIVIKLLMKIYSEGYYYDWTEKEQILFSKRVNVDINQVNVIINDCVKWGLFDENLFKEYKILTSKGIQSRYFEAVKRRQRVEIAEEFLLSDEETLKNYNNLVIVSINEDEEDIQKDNVDINSEDEGVNVDINPQSKVEESKVYKSSSNNTTTTETKTENSVAQVEADSTEQNNNLVAPIDADSIKQDAKLVDNVDADSMEQEYTVKRKKDLQQIENYYKQQIRRRNTCSSRDLSDIVFVYETYKQDVDFIISVMEKAKQDYIDRYGKLEINSFSYFLSIFEEKWNLLHGEKDRKTYKVNTSPVAKKTRFHNFQQRTDSYTADDLEAIAERKRQEYIEKLKKQSKAL